MRVRRAANLAIDCKTINDALTMGYSHVTGNPFVPDMFEFYWQPPAPVYDPAQAKQLLADAGYPNGFDAGFYNCDSSYANIAEAVVNNWGEVGIRIKLRPMERAAYIKAFAEKPYKNVIQAGPAGFGNAATRLESHAVTGGTFTYGSYPELDALFQQQAAELNYKRREAILHQMQQIGAREGDLRADLAARLHQRRRSTRGRVGLRAYPRLPLHRAVRRAGAESGLTYPNVGSACVRSASAASPSVGSRTE